MRKVAALVTISLIFGSASTMAKSNVPRCVDKTIFDACVIDFNWNEVLGYYFVKKSDGTVVKKVNSLFDGSTFSEAESALREFRANAICPPVRD